MSKVCYRRPVFMNDARRGKEAGLNDYSAVARRIRNRRGRASGSETKGILPSQRN
jgi:hypothetical protein